MNTTIKKYAVSSAITFLTGFLAVILTQVDTFTVDTLKSGAILGVIGAGARAGVKACIEYMIANKATLSTDVPQDSITST